MFGAIAGGIASALAGGAMSKLFGGGQKAASGGIQGDVLATDNNTVGMGDAGIKSAIQGSNVPNPDRKSGSAGMRRPTSYAVFCLKKKRSATPHDYSGQGVRMIRFIPVHVAQLEGNIDGLMIVILIRFVQNHS